MKNTILCMSISSDQQIYSENFWGGRIFGVVKKISAYRKFKEDCLIMKMFRGLIMKSFWRYTNDFGLFSNFFSL